MKLIFLIIFLIFSINIVSCETIIYDNLTTSNYKILKINDDLNIKYINEYEYEIYINGFLYDEIRKNEILYIPDNSNIVIKIPDTIKTDLTNPYIDFVKPILTIILSFLFTFIIVIIILYIVYKKVIRK